MKGRVAFWGRQFLVGIFWLTGLLVGIAIAYKVTACMDSVPRERLSASGSFGGILISSIVPLFGAFIAYRFNLDILAYLVLLANGFLYGFSSLYLSCVSGLAGSFIHLLFMFAPACCASFLVFSCAMFINGVGKRTNRIFCAIFAASILLCCLDYFLIL